jgi:hypothetical protein
MDSSCLTARGLETSVFILRRLSSFSVASLDSRVYVIDGVEWPEIEQVRRHLENSPREFDDPFALSDPPLGFEGLLEGLDHLLQSLFGISLGIVEKRQSWRPRPSGPEPMHFDTWYVPGLRAITAYLNIALTAREYRISRTFSELLLTEGKGFKEQAQIDRAKFSVVLREQARRGQGPIGPKAPRHLLSLASGSVLILDPRQIAHELRKGDGAVCRSWLTR